MQLIYILQNSNKLQNILFILIIIYKEFLVYIQRYCLYIKRDNSYCLINEVSNQNVLDITLCDKVCHCLAAGRWFLRELRFPLPIKQSGVKHHNPKPILAYLVS